MKYITIAVILLSISNLSSAKTLTIWNNTEENRVILEPGQDKKTLTRWPQVIEVRDCASHEMICHGDVLLGEGKGKHVYCMANESGCPDAAACAEAMPTFKRNSDGDFNIKLAPVKDGVSTILPTD